MSTKSDAKPDIAPDTSRRPAEPPQPFEPPPPQPGGTYFFTEAPKAKAPRPKKR